MAAKRVALVAVTLLISAGGSPNVISNVSISGPPPIHHGLIRTHDVDATVKKEVTAKKTSPAEVEADIEKAIASARGLSAKPVGFLRDRKNTGVADDDSTATVAESSVEATKELSTADSMEKAITELMTSGGKAGFAATPMGGSVMMIKDLITKTMAPKVKAAHSADQKLLNRMVNEIKKCASTKASAFGGADSEFTKYKDNSKLHKKCRADEAVRYTSKENCLVDQKSRFMIKVLKCKAFAATSRQVGTTENNKAIVGKGGSESVESYVRRLSTTFCGKHVHGPRGKISKPGGRGGGLDSGFLDKYLEAKEKCHKATKEYLDKVKECKVKAHAYNVKKSQCNQFQEGMDGASCKRAVLVKDACESYAGCYHTRTKGYRISEGKVRFNERDRKAEWRGLKRMECLISAFANGKVEAKEVDSCKGQTHSTDHLTIKYPSVPGLVKCAIPTLYPSTGAYKRAEFAPLPMLAKGKESQECVGVQEIGTTPAANSPKSCKCTRVTLNGHFSPGPLVKCTGCKDIYRSKDASSCPRGTKLFAPTSKTDWKTFLSGAGPLRDPHWIVDVTRPTNGCGGCTSNPMNSGNRKQASWTTSDGAPWWLRSTKYSEPNGDYGANCFLNLGKPSIKAGITFNDASCKVHSKSYYCQPEKIRLSPKAGSGASCKCSRVDLAGRYSAGALVKCEHCLTVYKSTQKNSCPKGMKIFSPRSREDWRTFLKSAGPLRAPNWIIDVTRPQNGCGGCTRYAMNSGVPQQATWKTSDGSAWWLRASRYTEPNGDYKANCFMDLFDPPTSANTVKFNDGSCKFRSRSYYCQPIASKDKGRNIKLARAAVDTQRRLVAWSELQPGIVEKVYYFKQGSKCPNLKTRDPNMIRKVDKINYPKTAGAFKGLSKKDHFAMRWDAYLIIEQAGVYTFYVGSDDGSVLYIDDKRVVNNDGTHAMRTAYGSVKLVRGQHLFSATMFEKAGSAAMKVMYKGPDTNGEHRYIGDGKSLKYVPSKGFKEEVYYIKDKGKMPKMSGSADMERIRPHVVYGETKNRWPGFKQADYFAVRWTGLLQITRSGNYRWSLLSDDGSQLYLNNKKIVDNDGRHALKNKESNARMSGQVQVKLEFFEHAGKACMIFRYMGPDTQNHMKFVPQKVMVANI